MGSFLNICSGYPPAFINKQICKCKTANHRVIINYQVMCVRTAVVTSRTMIKSLQLVKYGGKSENNRNPCSL